MARRGRAWYNSRTQPALHFSTARRCTFQGSSSLLVNVFGARHVDLGGSTPPDAKHGALC